MTALSPPYFIPIQRNVLIDSSVFKQALLNGGGTLGKIHVDSTDYQHNIQDQYYSVNVTVGEKSFKMFLDTGSYYSWIRGSACSAPSGDTSCRGQNIDPNHPSLTNLNSPNIPIYYGDGSSVTARIYRTNMAMNFNNLTSIGIQVGVTHVSSKQGNSFDGLLGLAYASTATIDSTYDSGNSNFFNQIGFSSSQQTFGMFLSVNDVGSELSLGGINTARYTGSLIKVPRYHGHGLWQLDMTNSIWSTTGSSITGGTLDKYKKRLTIDSGTSFIVLDTYPADRINAAIGATGTNGANIPCSKAQTGFNALI
jgi:hypothetical protein